MNTTIRIPDSEIAESVESTLRRWDESDVSDRIWAKDHTVWSTDPTEIANRLGWLDLPQTSEQRLPAIEELASAVLAEKIRHIVLLGMGGSSLAPEVFGEMLGDPDRSPEFVVLDTTHPDAVRIVDNAVDPAHTLFIVSSKSGTTLETLALFRTFWDRASRVTSAPGSRFMAITDAGSALDALAIKRGFSQICHAPPEVGGRNSALCDFGLVPAALTGADVTGLLQTAREVADASATSVVASDNPSIRLGVTLGALCKAGKNKLTFLCSPSMAAFPAWIEQLVAESLGKDGTGVVPVDHEPPMAPHHYGMDRVFVGMTMAGDSLGAIEGHLRTLEAAGHPVIRTNLEQPIDLGGEMFRWELATAAAGAVLGVNPFDQPDVQLAKMLAQEAMDSGRDTADVRDEVTLLVEDTGALRRGIDEWARPEPGDYVSVQAYIAPSPQNEKRLQKVRAALSRRLDIASTLGFGPRFLHSTGQLHKGGGNDGLFIQLVDVPHEDLPVPETGYTFGELIAAQALGDYRALAKRGRRVIRVNLGADPTSGLEALLNEIG